MSLAVHGTVEDLDAEPGAGGSLPRRPLRTDELQLLFTLLAAAGTETTRNTIAVGLAALSERPEDWAALRDDRSLLPGAVEEMLRWASSTPYNRRTATRDVELCRACAQHELDPVLFEKLRRPQGDPLFRRVSRQVIFG